MGIRRDEVMIVKNRLTQVGLSFKSEKKHRSAVFLCECGKRKVMVVSAVKRGNSRSCGCLHNEELRDRCKTHGLRNTPEYDIWSQMRQRCSSSNNSHAHRYKNRGITVCHRWNAFEYFLEDMGKRPGPGFSIDRIDNDGNYEPSNCRWATDIQQARNTSSNRMLTLDGETKCLKEWSNYYGIGLSTIHRRFKKGISLEEAITTPLRTARRSDV